MQAALTWPAFQQRTWDVIHTWSGVLMVLAALLHFVIHWRWAVNVTERYFMRKKIRLNRKGIAAAQQSTNKLDE